MDYDVSPFVAVNSKGNPQEWHFDIDIAGNGIAFKDDFPFPTIDQLIPKWPRYTKEMIQKLAPKASPDELEDLYHDYEGEYIDNDNALEISDGKVSNDVLSFLDITDEGKKAFDLFIQSEGFDEEGYGVERWHDPDPRVEILTLSDALSTINNLMKKHDHWRAIDLKDGYLLVNGYLLSPEEAAVDDDDFL